MDKNSLVKAMSHVRSLATAEMASRVSDGHLLDRFLGDRDEVAFAALVERHGAMVHRVCSRILRDPHDTEDACQATFLVLARRASGIRKRKSVASWMHGVARRVSLTLLRDRIERRRREGNQAGVEPTGVASSDQTWDEVKGCLDEELDRLPEKLRGPLVLCYLEGKTRDEAAAVLGYSQGRLHGLLERGRKALRDRLTKRGVSFGIGLLTAELAAGASRVVPPALAVRIVNSAATLAAGQELLPTLATAQTATIYHEVIRAMIHAKVKAVSLLVLTVGVACTMIGGGVAAMVPQRDRPVGVQTDKQSPGVPAARPVPLQLADLEDGEYLLQVTHIASRPKVQFPDSVIPDAEYTAVNVMMVLKLQFDGKRVTLAPDSTLYKNAVTGELEEQNESLRVYQLNGGLPAGGRLTLTQSQSGVSGVFTEFGSGVPVAASFKGALVRGGQPAKADPKPGTPKEPKKAEPKYRTLENPDKDVFVVSDRDEKWTDFFQRQRLVVGELDAKQLAAQFEAKEDSEKLFLNFASYNHAPNKKGPQSTFGANIRLAPIPAPVVKTLKDQKVRAVILRRGAGETDDAADDQKPPVWEVVGYTTRNPSQFFELRNTKGEFDPEALWYVKPVIAPMKKEEPDEGDGGNVRDRDRVETFFKQLRGARSKDEEKAVAVEFAKWLNDKGFQLQVEQRDGELWLLCPHLPPVTPWTTHRFLDPKSLDLLPVSQDRPKK